MQKSLFYKNFLCDILAKSARKITQIARQLRKQKPLLRGGRKSGFDCFIDYYDSAGSEASLPLRFIQRSAEKNRAGASLSNKKCERSVKPNNGRCGGDGSETYTHSRRGGGFRAAFVHLQKRLMNHKTHGGAKRRTIHLRKVGGVGKRQTHTQAVQFARICGRFFVARFH